MTEKGNCRFFTRRQNCLCWTTRNAEQTCQRGTEMIPEDLKARFPEKFVSENKVFSHIHRGDRIFIGTGCGEPQYLVGALIRYLEANPKAFFDAEVLHVWTLGITPYTNQKYERNFRYDSFFIASNTREAIN